jgi:uncharacterized membrane protein YccC
VNSLGPPRSTRSEILFSLKSFAAAMLALYLASRADLPRPFWAVLTTYVVAQPLAGTVRSKGLYRLAGTLIGSTATVLVVPALSNAPELLVLTLALWVGLCLYLSLQDRSARAYVFMLAGYTAALIGFPSVETPLLVFETAVSGCARTSRSCGGSPRSFARAPVITSPGTWARSRSEAHEAWKPGAFESSETL